MLTVDSRSSPKAFHSARYWRSSHTALRRHAVLPSYLMASSAAEPPPPPPPPPGGGEGSASNRSRSTPVAVEFVYPSGVPPLPVSRGEDWESEGSNAWIPSGSTAAPSVPSASGSQIVPVVNVEDDAEIADQSPEDDEDELMFPELVDRCSKQAMEDQYMEDIAFGARFDETDDEEKNENDDSLVLADYEGEDLPTIEWNRENPQLAKGTVFQTMMDCRNAITTYHILTKNNYEVIKSEPGFVKMELIRLLEWKIRREQKMQRRMKQQFNLRLKQQFNMRRLKQQMQRRLKQLNMRRLKPMEEIEAAVQHEEIEAANAEEIEAAVQHEEIEPMDREQREQMDVEWLQPMSPEESQQYYRHCLDSCKAMCDAHFEELMAEEKAEASQKKNKKEGKRKTQPVDVSLPVPRVRIDAKTIEAIVYNHAAKPPIQPSADPSLVKYTKTAAVPTLVIDATNIEAIADNIASTFDGAN
ncbi:hypothetical protein QYE76_012911 [Lolium multiflorum]|uniref:Uncharacterized protein n=1 Tax=Lolium multiflorum TaxID=4521 RepID=A0AAD8X748_LOLMU|nr:hypothetical protein QYE76_012911 [Lolium multiflorum]